MPLLAPGDLWGMAAMAVLLALPGLLVVRAPWPFVPFLSAAFWIVSWWWLPGLGGSRHHFLIGALFAFGAFGLLRLAKPLRLSRPRPATLLVLGVAAARLVPFVLWPVAPGADMSLHALSTRLLVWRDGIPAGYEPLLPIHVFGAYTPGLHELAADAALLSGADPARMAFLAAVVAHALLVVALYALLARFVGAPPAAIAAGLALGLARVPQGFFGWGGNPTVLALAFCVAAAALLVRGTNVSPAVAAGLLVGAALVTHPVMVALAALAVPVALLIALHDGAAAVLRRAAACAATALLVAAPHLLQLDYTLSGGERAWLAEHLRTHYAADWSRYSSYYPFAVLRYLVATANDAFLIAAGAGVALALRRRPREAAGGAVSVLLLLLVVGAARGGGLGPLVVFPERAVAVVVVLLGAGVATLVDVLWNAPGRLGRAVLLGLALVAGERAVRYYYAGGAATVMVGDDDRAAMAWLLANTAPRDVVCNDYRTAGLWVPALAGRSISAPHLPPFYFDEFRAGSEGRRCAWIYESDRFFFGPREAPRPVGEEVFRQGAVRILKSPP